MILYTGNILSTHGGSIGFIETMTLKLASRYTIKSVSSISSKPLRFLHMIISVLRYRNVCEVVLVDVFSTQAFWFAYAIGRLCSFLKVPYIPIIHGGDFVNRLGRSKKFCDHLFFKSYANIAPSKFLEYHLQKANYQVRYIPNFIELENYPFKLREKINPRILWVRAFHKIYNPMLAVEAVSRIKRPNLELCMVGSDTDGTRTIVEEYIKELKLEEMVTLTGRLLKKDWIKLSSQFDIFINTTTIDNMPVSVIEAMALGLPVVSTNVGGIPYLFEHEKDGILVPSNNAEAMADAILSLLDNPDQSVNISSQARKKVEEFDWEKVKLQWFDLLDQLVVVK